MKMISAVDDEMLQCPKKMMIVAEKTMNLPPKYQTMTAVDEILQLPMKMMIAADEMMSPLQ